MQFNTKKAAVPTDEASRAKVMMQIRGEFLELGMFRLASLEASFSS